GGFQGGGHGQSLGRGDMRQLERPAVGIDVVGERVGRGRAAGDDAGVVGGGDRLEVAVGDRLDLEDALAGLSVLVAEGQLHLFGAGGQARVVEGDQPVGAEGDDVLRFDGGVGE